ncbi:MAG: hypothetical protein CMP53_01380 [Flavobacteriales bacterium]|nr:hypothetical protein [Flavobacteriales bacterium]|tara:strand:+ start:217 stop:2235 length:2019 start_codon:yes stop_codon:yes gene_type:complete
MYFNNLENSNSLYLQQHATNPVHWQNWDENLLKNNITGNRLLVISIGYSSCHWCHVMEEESFEDAEVASVMNEHFISFKVDRETRPDLDSRYMSALQLMTGTGGWPLNIIALPDGTPVFGGTYFSKPDWIATLQQVSALWKKEPQQVLDYGVQMQAGMAEMIQVSLTPMKDRFRKEDFDDVVNFWMRTIDPIHGGPNGSPKFPMPSNYSFLLDYSLHSGNAAALEHTLLSLQKMALGGMYDWIHGGMTRYSTDRYWKVPHFEKMLYDNAQLLGLYARASRATKNKVFLDTAISIGDFLKNEMLLDCGLFASAIDADSPTPQNQKEEGGYYTWSADELNALSIPNRTFFNNYFDITPHSSWEGKYILHRSKPLQEVATQHKVSNTEALKWENQWKSILIDAAKKRGHSHPKPSRDPKALTNCNAMLVQGYFDMHLAAPENGFDSLALKLLDSIQGMLVKGHQVLHELNGNEGFLDDYATLGIAYLKGYALTGVEDYVNKATKLAQEIQSQFSIDGSPFYKYASESSAKWQEVIEIEDNVIPSANSFVAQFFRELAAYGGERTWAEKSSNMVRSIHGKVFKNGQNFSHWLNIALAQSYSSKEVVAIGTQSSTLLESITNSHYRPNTLYLQSPNSGTLPLTLDRNPKESTYFICSHGSCSLPTSEQQVALELWMQ